MLSIWNEQRELSFRPWGILHRQSV